MTNPARPAGEHDGHAAATPHPGTRPDDPDIAFGLCDLGLGCPELGSVRISELESVRLMGGVLGIERDRHWEANKTLYAYADKARALGYIKA